MGNCQQLSDVTSAQKRSNIYPLFYEIKQDLELNNLFKKLQVDLKKLTDMRLNQKQYQENLNNLFGENLDNADVYHAIKTITVAVQVINKCDHAKLKDFTLTDKSPFFLNIKKANKDKEVLASINSYKQLMHCTEQNKSFIDQIIEQVNTIEKYLALKSKEFLQQELIIYNLKQLKSSLEKVTLYNNQYINPILEDHKEASANFSNIFKEVFKRSQIFQEQKIQSIKNISNILLSEKTATSI